MPTLVEVKRSRDTRIRREVIGQMLDYAANAVVYWPVEQMQARFERRCSDENRESSDVLQEFLSAEADPDHFWQLAKTNLQAGKIRMVFVADQIPTELQRIIEFLNVQMDPAQVLGVEVKQYVGQGQQAMVPRVLGQTAEAEKKKSAVGEPARQWDEPTFFRELEDRNAPEVTAAGRQILQWAQDRGLRLKWGKGKTDGRVHPTIDHAGKEHKLVAIFTDGKVEVQFGHMKSYPPFDVDAKRKELWVRLNQIGGVNIPADGLATFPRFPLTALTQAAYIQHFLNTFDWYANEVRAP